MHPYTPLHTQNSFSFNELLIFIDGVMSLQGEWCSSRDNISFLIQMRRKAVKLRQFPLGGAKVNSTCIGTTLLSYFVVGDSHNNIRLYTFENQEEIEVYSSNSNNSVQTEVTAVALSCTEKEIFSGSNRGIINVWDMETAKPHTLLRGHSTSVNCFGIYPQDTSRLASGSYDTMVKLWDIRDKNNFSTLKGHSKPITSISISPDGCILLSASEDSTARVWDLRYSEKPLYVASEHNGPILKAKFNPEDCMFATCSMDKTAKYFRCEDKCYGLTSSTEMVATPITAIGFSQDGKTLYTAANDVLKSWNMYKNGLLLETFDAGWKGVQDIAMVKGALMGIGCGGGAVSLWVCDVQRKIKNSSQVSVTQESFVLPKIGKGARFNDDNQISELQNIVGKAIQKVNTIQERPTKDRETSEKRAQEAAQRKRAQYEKRRDELQKRREEQQKKRQLRAQKQAKEREERLLKQQQRKRALQQKRRMQQQEKRIQQQRRKQELQRQRIERQRVMQERVRAAMQQNNMEMTLEQDMLDNSSMMNISTFVTDGQQREKIRQIELINDILKDSLKYENILSQRMSKLMPILNFWKHGNTKAALQCLQAQAHAVKIDFSSTILTTPRFKTGVTPEVALYLSNMLGDLLASQKHSSYIVLVLKNLNTLVLMFKDQLIKIKTFNPLTRVDISREERLAKYDKLIDGFLNIFRLDRLKKYNEAYKKAEREERLQIAHELYKNLEEILIKIMPKPEPEAV